MTAQTTEHDDVHEGEVVDEQQPEQPEVQQPAEVDTEATGQVIELHGQRGALTLRPGQVHLDTHQINALVAIGIDTRADPGIVPHIRPFIHMCQVRGLDPWAREAYLIGRGKDDKRKYTMQVGIDGYRKMAGATGKFIRVKKVLWTGSDDDDRSYVQARDEDGDVVMQRVWFDQWPESRGNPGAAKVVIEHYDDYGNVTSTPAIADWAMYAPYKDVWDYNPSKGKRAPVIDPETGKTKQELNEMWAKGGPHMLAKCLPGRAKIQTDQGTLSIGEIVRNRMQVRVRSIDLDTGAEVWQPIVNWWTNLSTNEWVRLWTPNGSRGNKPVRLTGDHPVWTPDGWRKAGEIVEGDRVAVTSPSLSAQQRQVILGGLLGDAHLAGRKRESTQPHFAVTHSTAQGDYARWTAQALASLGTKVSEGANGDGTGKRHPVVRVRTAAAAALYEFRQMRPVEWLRDLDALGLAVWIMDDGAIKATGGKSGSVSLDIHCCGFGADFADLAVEWFRDRSIVAKVHRRDKNPYLSIGVEDTRYVLNLIAPYLRADGTRKVWVAGPIEQGHEHGMAFVPVTRVEHVRRRKAETRYDIEVEGTHTFVTNGLVVSNCAEALAHRKAFPGAMAGVYVHEEMHRLDQAERNRQQAETREARQRAYAEHQQRRAVTAQAAAQQTVPGEVEQPESAPLPPVHVSEAVAETLDEMRAQQDERAQRPAEREQPEPQVSDEQRAQWLRAEVEMLAQVLDRSVASLYNRQVRALRKSADEFTADDLWAVVKTLRPHGIAALGRNNRTTEAEAYTAATEAEQVAPVPVLLGHEAEAGPEQPPTDVDPHQPHAYVDNQGVCAVEGCEQFEDDIIHEV